MIELTVAQLVAALLISFITGMIVTLLRVVNMRITIEDILNSPPKVWTKAEAREMLVRLGVLDEDGNIRPPWQDVFVKKSDISGGMYNSVDMYGKEWKEEDGKT